jgi:hypothetical protein
MDLALGELQSLLARLITSTEGVNTQLQGDSLAPEKIEKTFMETGASERSSGCRFTRPLTSADFWNVLRKITPPRWR